MDSPYEPLVLKKMNTSRDQFDLDQGSLHADAVTPMDSEHTEAKVCPTNTAEKCRRILSRTSEKSRSLFAGKMDSPSEKIKILNRTPEKSSFLFAGKMDSPSEKSKILTRTLDENSLQLAGKRDSPSEKSKILSRTPDENSLQLAGKRDSPSVKSKILSRAPDDNSLQFAAGRDSPCQKSKVLSRTPDENCLHFAGTRDNPPDNSKFCFSRPLADFQAMQCTYQAPAAAQHLRIQDYCKDILASAKGSETGTSFLGFKSAFSFL